MKSGRGNTVTDPGLKKEIEALHKVYLHHPKDTVTLNRLAELTGADNWLELAGRHGNVNAYLQLALNARNKQAYDHWREKATNRVQAMDFQDQPEGCRQVETDPPRDVLSLSRGLARAW